MRLQDIGLTRKNWKESLKQGAAITAIGIIVLFVVGIVIGVDPLPRGAEWFAFYIIVSVPLQELVFRGIITGKLEHFGKGVAVVVSATVYALIHIQNPLLTALTFAAGLAWGWSFLSTRNLAGQIFSHLILGIILFVFIL